MAITGANRISFEMAVYRIIGMARMAVKRVIAELNDPKEQGGYFCLVANDGNPTALPMLIRGIGNVPAEKGRKYLELAQEKARRLAENPDHWTSWQSRNPEENQWGGAIVADSYILSFSGLPELADEAAMLLTAFSLGLLSEVQATAFAQHSGNELFYKMMATPD